MQFAPPFAQALARLLVHVLASVVQPRSMPEVCALLKLFISTSQVMGMERRLWSSGLAHDTSQGTPEMYCTPNFDWFEGLRSTCTGTAETPTPPVLKASAAP